MDCEEFIEQICTDPTQSTPALRSHADECNSCAAYARRAHTAESLIRAALRFDTTRFAEPPPRFAASGSIAAAVIAGFMLWFAAAVERPASSSELVEAVLEHWDHEPAALLAGATPVSPGSLDEVLAGEATIDLAALDLADVGPVTYAKKCIVAGQWMAHLVVQSDNGPVTILLTPQQTVDAALPLEHPQRRLGGGIFPSGVGAVAVFGADGAASEPLARAIAATINISI